MKLYTVIIVSGPDNGEKYPDICYDGRHPICTQFKQHAEDHLKMLQEYTPDAVFKLGEINV